MKNLKCESCTFWDEDANEQPCAGCFDNVNFVKKASTKFYWFTFADGYRACCRGYSALERKVEERKHGKLVKKEAAE